MSAQRRQGRFLRMHGDRIATPGAHGIEQERQRRQVIEMRVREKHVVDARQRLDVEIADAGAGVDQDIVVHQQRRRTPPRADTAAATQNPYAHPPIRLAPAGPAFKDRPGCAIMLCIPL